MTIRMLFNEFSYNNAFGSNMEYVQLWKPRNLKATDYLW